MIADNLGRPLTADEAAAAGSLVAAVDGQPLHLRQCAALASEGRHSLRALARQAAGDPEILDRLSINALAQHQRRALAALALAAGTLLPADVVDAIGQVSYLAQWLQSLHGRGLAEQCEASVCAISGATVTFGQPGRCVIDANQAGDARYQPAPQVQQVVVVTGIPQRIRFSAPAQGQVDQSATLKAVGRRIAQPWSCSRWITPVGRGYATCPAPTVPRCATPPPGGA